jgi:hypothetical protein
MALNLPSARDVKTPIAFSLDRISRTGDLQTAILLTYITLGWMTIEGTASLILGWFSKSLLLEAFGMDSVIELLSAGGQRGRSRPDSVPRKRRSGSSQR